MYLPFVSSFKLLIKSLDCSCLTWKDCVTRIVVASRFLGLLRRKKLTYLLFGMLCCGFALLRNQGGLRMNTFSWAGSYRAPTVFEHPDAWKFSARLVSRLSITVLGSTFGCAIRLEERITRKLWHPSLRTPWMGEFDQMLCKVWMVQSKAGGIGGMYASNDWIRGLADRGKAFAERVERCFDVVVWVG